MAGFARGGRLVTRYEQLAVKRLTTVKLATVRRGFRSLDLSERAS